MFNIIIYIFHAFLNDLIIIYMEGAIPYLVFNT